MRWLSGLEIWWLATNISPKLVFVVLPLACTCNLILHCCVLSVCLLSGGAVISQSTTPSREMYLYSSENVYTAGKQLLLLQRVEKKEKGRNSLTHITFATITASSPDDGCYTRRATKPQQLTLILDLPIPKQHALHAHPHTYEHQRVESGEVPTRDGARVQSYQI